MLPYGSTAPEAILAAHQAECGISFQDALTFAVAAGAPIKSTMAILQHTAQEIAVLASSSIQRPKELDGKTYAGFGYPNEVPTLQAVIRHDGGTGEFDTVTLDTAAYEALYQKRADFVITFSAWEGIEAGQRDIPLRTFQFTDYGFPDFYQVVLACDARLARARSGRPRRRSSARRSRGSSSPPPDPDDGGADPRRPEPGRVRRQPGAAARVARATSPSSGLLVDAAGKGGTQTLDTVDRLLVVPVRPGPARRRRRQAARPRRPTTRSLFTNDFLP